MLTVIEFISVFCVIGTKFLKIFKLKYVLQNFETKLILICALLLYSFLKRNKQVGVSLH